MDWAENTLRPKADLAYKGEGEYSPGSWCQFCKAAVKCRARAEAKLDLARFEFAQPPLLSDAEIEEILGKLDDLTKWANEIMAYAQDAAINHGKEWAGYKLVESRTNRKYTDEDAVARAAASAGYRNIYKKTLISITEMEKLMGKQTFKEILGGLIAKPIGKPTLVPASDKRPAITTTGAKHDFNEFKGEKNMANKTNSTKVVTGVVRLSYKHVWEPASVNGSNPKYSVSLIIPKNDTKTIAAINQAIDNAIRDGAAKFGGKIPPKGALKLPLRDGDTEREDEAYRGIACGLGNIQKVRDGEPLGGKTSAADDFATDLDDDFLA